MKHQDHEVQEMKKKKMEREREKDGEGEREKERKSEARTFSSLITSKSIFYPKEGETRHGFSTRENLQSPLFKK